MAGYGDAELKTLQLRFDLLDVRELLPSLVAWCDRKRIVAAHERKTAIFAALAREQKKREAARKLLAEATGPPIAVSADLTKALGRRRRPGAR